MSNNEQPKLLVSLQNDNSKQIFGTMPKIGTSLSTAFDVYNSGPDITLCAFEHTLIPLGFKAFIPSSHWVFLLPRSSTHAKKKIHALYGVIDEDYENYWYFSAQYIPHSNLFSSFTEMNSSKLTIKRGEAIAQIILMKRNDITVEEINDEKFNELCKQRNGERGLGGFGSTG